MKTLSLLILGLAFCAYPFKALAQPCDLCGTDASEWIDGFMINGFSGFLAPPGGSVGGCTDPYLFDAYYATLKIGGFQTFTLTPGFSGSVKSEFWRIWIDLNHDGDFDDAGDLVYSSASGSTGTVADSFFIPANVIEGPALMRVAMRRGSLPPNCGNYSSGQVLTYHSVYLDVCDLSFSDACAREFIQSVQLNTINNSSFCGNQGYQNFTNQATTLNAGSSYQLKLTPGFVGAAHPERWLVWIDYNHDLDFGDSGEKVFDSGAVGYYSTVTGTIQVPAGAHNANTKMRIKMIPTDAGTLSTEPCAYVPVLGFPPEDVYGEAEDYSIVINAISLEVQYDAPATLVKDVLIGGNCFDVSNVAFSGSLSQIGSFSKGLTNIGFDRGIILATGDISVASGLNDSDGASGGYGAAITDLDLIQLAGGGSTFDLAKLEFDITPTQTPLTFEYVFASEEYCEYVNTQFSDAFGLFISGPGISGPFNGAANLAVIPATNTPVSIANVNHLVNAGYYVNNQPVTSDNLCGQSPSSQIAVQQTQYDGFTKKMTAVASVIPCETYHIQLKIADLGDGIWDSALFLKAGSFDAGGNASVEWLVNGAPDINQVTEGCGTAELRIRRVGGNANLPLPVSFSISGTATAAVDYLPISTTYIIPANVNELLVPVTIINDLISEGAETLSIALANPCSCADPVVTLSIQDKTPLSVVADTLSICGPSGGAIVAAHVGGGAAPYSYAWSNGGTAQEISVFASNSTSYTVTVTDACGNTAMAKARVNVLSTSTAMFLLPAPQICPGQSAQLTVDFTGIGPFDFSYQINGVPQPVITGITNDPYTITINQPGLYQPSGLIDAAGCPGAVSGALLVINSTLSLSGVVTDASCDNVPDGKINTTVTGGQGPYQYAWSGPTPQGNLPDPNHILPGNYSVTVTDGLGCALIQSFNVGGPPCGWTVTTTGRNHTMILPANLISDLDMPLQNGDWIGAFYDSLGTLKCAGYGIWTGASSSFPIYGNDAAAPAKNGFNTNETFKIKVRRKALNQDFDAKVEYAPPGTLGLVTHTDKYADDGISMITSISTAFRIPLAVGWNMISSYIEPAHPDMLEVFVPLASHVDIVKDDHGLSAIPSLQINTLGAWDVREGYQVKANQKDTLAILGQKVIPEAIPIPLSPGWQMIGYLRDKPQHIDTVFKLIKNQILLVKNNNGNSYSPQFGINTIGQMLPGQGYKVNAQSNVTLWYRPNFGGAAESRVDNNPPLRHFILENGFNSGQNATLFLSTGEAAQVLRPGDEIGVFNGFGRLCGSAAYRQENLAITVWGDDPTTGALKEGLSPEEPYTFRYWNSETHQEYPLSVTLQSGNRAYQPDGIEFIEALRVLAAEAFVVPGVSALQVYPNPASDRLHIQIESQTAGTTELALVGANGATVLYRQTLEYAAGETSHTLPVPASLASGVYCLRFNFESGVVNRLVWVKRD